MTELAPPSHPDPSRTLLLLQRLGTGLCGVAAALMGLHFFTPNTVNLDVHLDASHQWVIAWAYQNGYQWGSDILFTYGPLGFIRARAYFPGMGFFEQFLVFAYFGLLGYLLWRFLRLDTAPVRSSLIVLPALYLFFCTDQTYDQLILFLYLGGGYYLLSDTKFSTVDTVLVLTFFILNFYLKYTFALLSVALLFLLFGSAWLRNNRPIAGIGLLLGVGMGGILIGHFPWDVAAYLWNTWPIATGFSRSMMVWGNSWEWIVFLILSCLASLGFYLHLWKTRSLAELGLFVIWCTGTGLLVWKQSFVRHDAHALGAGSYLLLAIFFFMRVTLDNFNREKATRIIAYFLSLCGFAGTAYTMVLLQQYPDIDYSSKFLRNVAHHSPHRFPANMRAALDYETLNQRYHDRIRELVVANPLPPLHGTVDFYHSRAGLLLAHGADYRPRPVFQSYSAYTPGTIRKNRAHLAGENAPDQIFTDFSPADKRYVMLEDGLSWLEILERYRPEARSRELLLWEQVKAENTGLVSLELLEEGESVLGESWSLEGYGGDPLWVELDVSLSVEGKLQNLLFKSSPLELEYQFAGGNPVVREAPPGMLKTGFLLSPYIEGTDDFIWFAANMGADQPLPFTHAPTAIRLVEDQALLKSYRERFTYRLYRMRLENLPLMDSSYLGTIRTELHDAFHAYQSLKEEPSTHMSQLRFTEALGTHLFAHAECRFTLANPNPGGKVSIEYGLKDASWEGENATDGVIFRIYALSGDEQRLIFENAITPKTEEEDRGRQESIVKLPSGAERILLETHPRETSNWDWSYWGPITEIDVENE